MSTQCRHFVQNAWKKELCSNCFKAREDHANNQETLRPVVARTANSVKRVAHKVQGILRPKESNSLCNVQQQVRSKRKNVAFPDSLAEIIGYDGGDDFASDEESGYTVDDPDSLNGDTSLEVDELPDSEEERALGNLTRANTNFNTVTANLSSPPEEPKTPAKSFSSLMLGRAQKDGDGRKTTLLVSVKPFGGDDSLPTARRPSDKKSLDITKPKVSSETLDVKVELSIIKPMKKPINEKPLHVTNKSLTSTTTASLGKIVDMPLITSTNLITVMRDESAHKALESPKKTPSAATMITATGITEQRRVTSIARTPAIKKSENEKPRIMAQPSADHNAARNHKNLEMSNGVELSLSPIVVTGDRSDGSSTNFAKLPQEIPSYKSTSRMSDLMERRVEGEAAHEKYTFEVSRESAGEPDGKADEELVAEPSKERQRLAEPRASFLHGTSSEPRPKPSVPLKPIGSSLASILSESRAYEFRVGQKTNGGLAHARSDSHLCDSERLANAKPGQLQLAGRQVERAAAVESSGQLNDSDATPKSSCPRSSTERDEQTEEELDGEEEDEEERRSSSKRRMAPQPPSGHEDSGLFSRLSSTAGKLECPKTREKDKRERASSCSPKFRKTICEAPNPCAPTRPPEPAPRRNMSLSQDSLAAGDRLVEEKKKGRSKFSLKKFLRMGSRKDVDMTGSSSGSRNVEIPSTPQPKPRLEIIHPLELDGAAVQVLRNEKSCGEDSTDSTKSESQSNGWQGSHAAQHLTTARPSKPPPPPRAQSLDESSRAGSSSRGPQQPSGPGASGKPSGAGAKAWQPSGGSSASDSIYANLGVIRSGLAPAKPRRTSSMRDQQPQAQPCSSRPDEELVTVTAGQSRHRGLAERQRTPASDSSVSSEAPTCEYLSTSSIDHDDSSLELRHGAGNHPVTKRQSDSGTLDSAGQHELKFQQPLFIRSSSLPYCMSETEAELRSPFRPYSHNDKVFNAEENWKKEEESRIGRLRQRRGRSIVHRSLEDNYGAVIVANHEALAQFLEQTNQATPLGTSLRGLKAASLRFRDFNVDRSTALVTGRRVFLSAAWNEQNVTVCVAFEPGMHVSRKEFYLAPIAEFIDTVPKDIAELGYSTGRKTAEATISVLPRLQVNTLKSFAEAIGEAEASIKDENATRESSFVLLQLVSALKSLQARGIEEAPGSLVNVVLCRENKDAYHRLYLFQGLSIDSSENNKDEYVSLCQCALNALEELNLVKKLPLIQELLMREKAITLSQVKSILEFSLWGPADVTLGGPRERETALQRWLDLERATVLHALVRARAQLTVTDEYQLLFLVRTSAKVMCEASLQLDRQRTGLLSVGGIL